MNLAHISGAGFAYPDNAPASLAAYIQAILKAFPNGIFTAIDQEGQQHSDSYANLYTFAVQIFSFLKGKGLRSETEIILCFDNVLDFIPAAWACILAGYKWIPWSAIESRRNEKGFISGLQSLQGRLNQPWILTSAAEMEGIAAQTFLNSDKLLILQSIKQTGVVSNDNVSGIEDCSNQGDVIVTTSGTTGQPKLARIANRVLLNRLYRPANQNNAVEMIYCFPLHSISGMAVLFPLSAHTVYFHPNRLASHPHDFLLAIEIQQRQWIGISSYMASLLISAIDRLTLKNDLSSLQGVTFGADFIVPTTVKKLLSRFERLGANSLNISLVYGMTECGPICRTDVTAKQFLQQYSHVVIPEIGACVTGRSVRIVDDFENVVQENQTGDIQVYAPAHLFSGYYDDDEVTQQSFTQDGWFKTSDTGFIKDAKLTVTGRKGNKIVINGKNFLLSQLEAPLVNLPGIKQGRVIAAPIRSVDNISEELAVFFVPESFEEQVLNTIGHAVNKELANTVLVKHFIPITENDFEYTVTGKIRRDAIIEKYSQGKLTAFIPNKKTLENNPHDKLRDYLIELWTSLLKLNHSPDLKENFFNLGGDSLASATLISEIENKLNCQLPLVDFYKNPTIDYLIQILKNAPSNLQSSDKPIENSHFTEAQLLHKIESYMGSWEGQRQFDGSLIVGMNTQGTKIPIFWVFQDYKELRQLAQYLGSEQPVYGMRSYVNILKVKDYTADAIQALVNRYLWEILAIPVNHPVILGGNCQGGIIALALAKTLKRIGKTPACLVLMEWSFSFGSYTAPVLFLYGEQSYTASIYTQPESAQLNWRQDFPNHKIAAISGNHGQFFKEQNVLSLVNVLAKNTEEITQTVANL